MQERVAAVTIPKTLAERISKAAAAQKAYEDLAGAYGEVAESQTYKDSAGVEDGPCDKRLLVHCGSHCWHCRLQISRRESSK